MTATQKIVVIALLSANLFLFCLIVLVAYNVVIQSQPQAATPVPVIAQKTEAVASPTSIPTDTPVPSRTPGVTSFATSTRAATTPSVSKNGLAATLRTVDVLANDILFDRLRNRLYASVPAKAGGGGNSIISISVPTGTISSSIFIGSEPRVLAISDDGQYLYVGLNGSASVRRVNLVSQTAELEFSLGTGNCGPIVVEDMAVVPGNPRAIAISKRNSRCSPRHEGVAVYDDGVPRAKTTPGHTGSNVIEFSDSTGILYGYNNETTEYGLRVMNITPTGVVISATFPYLLSGFDNDIHFNNGFLYSTNGRVIDIRTMSLIGTFPTTGYVVPDSKAQRVHFLTLSSLSGPFQIKIFDQKSFVAIDIVDLPDLEGIPRGFIQLAADLFATHTTANKIYLIRLAPGGLNARVFTHQN